MSTTTIRPIVRFAPSPSSKIGMHLGNAKTALFNYLFAKKYGGDFLFRIENSDQKRAYDEGAQGILDELNWLGLTPNMGFGTDNKPAGVYTQMERVGKYQEVANKLIEDGYAYRCYCTEEELDIKRADALAKNPKEPFKYPGTCRHIKEKLDKPCVIRFKAPTEGYTEFEDITFGKRQMPNKENYDFVIMRADGSPLFILAVVVDDALIDHVTHVIRGNDHLKNLVPAILLYNAIGAKQPVWTHLSLLLGSGGQKLAKRDGSVSVAEYREKGYSPGAILNYMARFGWSSGNKEIFSLEELIEHFKLDDCHGTNGKFDPVKFLAINHSHLKSETLTPDARYAELVKPFIDAKKIGNFTTGELIPFISVAREKAKTFVEAADIIEPLLRHMEPDEDLAQASFSSGNKDWLRGINAALCNVGNWSEDNVKASINTYLQIHDLTMKDIGAPLRVALLGQKTSPDLFKVLHALGKPNTIRRLNSTMERYMHI